MADLVTNNIPTVGGQPNLQAALVAATSSGDSAEVGSGLFLYAFNAHATLSRTITFVTPQTVDGHTVANGTLVIAALDFGIMPLTDVYRGTSGRASVTYSDSGADITVAVYKLGK